MSLPLNDIPACRHAEGTISSSGGPDVWRMASEDSEEFVPGFTLIHRLRDLDDLDETVGSHMAILDHQPYAVRELLKVGLLRRAQWMPAEERNDHFHQLRSP